MTHNLSRPQHFGLSSVLLSCMSPAAAVQDLAYLPRETWGNIPQGTGRALHVRKNEQTSLQDELTLMRSKDC